MCPIKVTIGARVSSALSLRLANDIYHKARHFFCHIGSPETEVKVG